LHAQGKVAVSAAHFIGDETYCLQIKAVAFTQP